MKKITPKQKELLSYIESYIKINGIPPTYAEMGEEFDVCPTAIADKVKALEKKGYLMVKKGIARGITLPKRRGLYVVTEKAILEGKHKDIIKLYPKKHLLTD